MAEDIALEDAMAAAAEQAGTEAGEMAMRTAADSLGRELGVDATVEGSGADAELKVNGQTVDLDSVSVKMTEGNYGEALKEMGVDTSPGTPGGDFVESQQASFDASEQGQVKEALKTPTESPEGLRENPTREEFKEDVAKDSELKSKVDDLEQQIKDLKGEADAPEELSKTEKFKKFMDGLPKLKMLFGALFIAALIYFCIDLYDFIKGIQNAENGCWAINKDGSKCKIAALTINSDDLQQPDGSFMGIPSNGPTFRTCQPCKDMNCSSGDWIPALADACACGATLDFSGYEYLNRKNANSCVKCAAKDALPSTSLKPACPNVSGCISKDEASVNTMNGECSSWCETSALKLKAGTVIQCTNKTFAQAAGDVIPDLLKGLGNLLGPFEKILMWIAIGIVILVIGYVIIKEVVHYVGSSKSRPRRVQPEYDYEPQRITIPVPTPNYVPTPITVPVPPVQPAKVAFRKYNSIINGSG